MFVGMVTSINPFLFGGEQKDAFSSWVLTRSPGEFSDGGELLPEVKGILYLLQLAVS